MGGASLTLGMSHGYAFGLRLERQRFLSYIGVVSRSLFPKRELKSEGHFKETHFALVRRFRASHIGFQRGFTRLGGDCKISFILDQAFRHARAVHGQLEFSFAGRRGGTIPAFSANRRHTQTKTFGHPCIRFFVITTHHVSTNKGNNRILWGETPQACPQCYYHQLRDGLQSLPTPTDHHQCPS